ncbi:MAG: AbrB/MazE/SpoVT family DNA-binding domain-containing protein [Actinomycetota bacterium]
MGAVTSKGQITVPREVREALGLEPGSRVEFEVKAGVATLRKLVPAEVFERWRGFLRTKAGARRTDEVMEELRGR